MEPSHHPTVSSWGNLHPFVGPGCCAASCPRGFEPTALGSRAERLHCQCTLRLCWAGRRRCARARRKGTRVNAGRGGVLECLQMVISGGRQVWTLVDIYTCKPKARL